MNVYLIVGAVVVVAITAFSWFAHRQYKRIGRRCDGKGCGNTRVKRICKILLPPDEVVSWRSPEDKWRWWIRRPIKLTFTVCEREEKHDGVKRIKLVKIDKSPMSVWHAIYVKRYHKEQYYLTDIDLVEVTRQELRRLYLGGKHENLDSQASDTPPLSLGALFEDYLEELSEVIGE